VRFVVLHVGARFLPLASARAHARPRTHAGALTHMCAHADKETHAHAHTCTPTHTHVPIPNVFSFPPFSALGLLMLWSRRVTNQGSQIPVENTTTPIAIGNTVSALSWAARLLPVGYEGPRAAGCGNKCRMACAWKDFSLACLKLPARLFVVIRFSPA